MKDVKEDEFEAKFIAWVRETVEKLKDNEVVENRIAIRDEIEELEAELEAVNE